MASPVFMSKPPPGFSLTAIVRGIQLAILGAYRTLQNPEVFSSEFYRNAWTAVKYSVIIQLVVMVPLYTLKSFLSVVSFLFRRHWNLSSLTSDATHFQRHVLNMGVFLVSFVRFFRNELDDIFFIGLKYTDEVTLKKHPERTNSLYFKALDTLPEFEDYRHIKRSPLKNMGQAFTSLKLQLANSNEFESFLKRYLTNTLTNLSVYLLAKTPKIGPIIMALITFQTFNDKIGTVPSSVFVFILNIIPSNYHRQLLYTFWGSNNLSHDLLMPYFSKIKLTNFQKNQWVKSRQGVLFGFGLCFFYLMNKFPLISIFIYGIAQSSAAYLITKVTDPPPSQMSSLIDWNSTQLIWNKEKENYILTGNFFKSDEGFKPLPGSFLFFDHKLDEHNSDPNIQKMEESFKRK